MACNDAGINLVLLHGDKDVGRKWCVFIQKLFMDELPEEYRDMNLDVLSENVTTLADDEICNINSCDYKMVLFDAEVLKILKDRESLFRNSGVLEMQPERVIILLLADEKNKNFYQDAKLTLCGFPDHDGFNIIQAKNPSQIFSEVMTVLSPIHIVPHPSIMSSEDKDQHITFISSKAFPIGSSIEYVIELSHEKKTREASATLFNPYTLLMPNPGHPPGLVTMKIFICTSVLPPNGGDPEISRTQIGADLKVWFQSDLDKVYAILDNQNNPMSFLCQGLQEDPLDRSTNAIDKIDKLLTESFKQNVPDNKLFLVFGNDQQLTDDQDRFSTEYVPTLLHFSAMYGLRDLTAALLQCPGAVHAYGIANSEGDYPTTLAEKFGHWTLRDFMQNFMEVAALVHEEYGQKSTLQISQIMSSMVQGQFIRLPGVTDDPEDINCSATKSDNCSVWFCRCSGLIVAILNSAFHNVFLYFPDYVGDVTRNLIYIQLDGVLTPLSAPPGYLAMQPLRCGETNLASDNPDSMMRKIFQSKPEEPETDYEILDGGPSHIPSIRRGSSFQSQSISSPPPILPLRDERTIGNMLNFEPKELLSEIHTNVSPAQEELISLQKKVKDNEITINQAVFRFKEWERRHKERAASFQFQQENLQRVRQSLMRSREEKEMRGESGTIKISDPIIAGSSTYGQVLLKTRKEVMMKGVYGDGFTGNAPHDNYAPRPMPTPRDSPPISNPSSSVSSPNPSFRKFRTSLRGSSQSSVKSTTSSDSPYRRLPPIPSPRPLPPGVPKDPPNPGGLHYDLGGRNPHNIREDDVPPPPLPPRDVRVGSIPDNRPALPPRIPNVR